MGLVIVTGLSGAGKSRTIDALEDIGYFCIDNMPPQLLPKFSEIMTVAEDKLLNVAIVIDLRGRSLFSGLEHSLAQLREDKIDYKLLFLECSDEELIRRFKETRRKHPLIAQNEGRLEDSIKAERVLLRPFKGMSDYVIDTSHIAPAALRTKIVEIFENDSSSKLIVTLSSFGFKYGVPSDADLVFDVRCFPNPFYVDALKKSTGMETDVYNFVFDNADSNLIFSKIDDLIKTLIPLYIKEGKSQVSIAFGCTGGKHRSVAFARRMYDSLQGKDVLVKLNNRDILKE